MAIEHQPRSIAAEVALLFLDELEPRIDSDPELLVSSEAILALAAIRRGDPARWDHWRAILTRYQKYEVVDYMLCEPKADGAEFSKADLSDLFSADGERGARNDPGSPHCSRRTIPVRDDTQESVGAGSAFAPTASAAIAWENSRPVSNQLIAFPDLNGATLR